MNLVIDPYSVLHYDCIPCSKVVLRTQPPACHYHLNYYTGCFPRRHLYLHLQCLEIDKLWQTTSITNLRAARTELLNVLRERRLISTVLTVAPGLVILGPTVWGKLDDQNSRPLKSPTSMHFDSSFHTQRKQHFKCTPVIPENQAMETMF